MYTMNFHHVLVPPIISKQKCVIAVAINIKYVPVRRGKNVTPLIFLLKIRIYGRIYNSWLWVKKYIIVSRIGPLNDFAL